MFCHQCKEMIEELGIGTGPFNFHGPDDAHPGVTCEEIESMEW